MSADTKQQCNTTLYEPTLSYIACRHADLAAIRDIQNNGRKVRIFIGTGYFVINEKTDADLNGLYIRDINVYDFININTKNCSLSIVLTATDQKPQKSLKR